MLQIGTCKYILTESILKHENRKRGVPRAWQDPRQRGWGRLNLLTHLLWIFLKLPPNGRVDRVEAQHA